MEYDLRSCQPDGEELSNVPPNQAAKNPCQTDLGTDQKRQSTGTALQDQSYDLIDEGSEVQARAQTEQEPPSDDSDFEAQRFQQGGEELDQSVGP